MAAARAPVLRHLLSCQTRTLRASNQRRWAQVQDVRFLATTQQPRSVIEKYRAKLDQKAREEGHADIDSLKAAYADKIETLRKEADITTTIPPPPLPSADLQQQQQQHQQQPTPQPSPTTSTPHPRSTPNETSSSPSPTGIKPLSSILDLPKARALPLRELTAIWRLHHASRANSLCAVIPGSTFSAMDAAARSISAQFVLPVPVRQEGLPPDAAGLDGGAGVGGGNGNAAELHFCQWTWDPPTRTATVLFTQLAEYKARGEFAAPHTTVTHYTDLQHHTPPVGVDESAGQRGISGGREGVVLMQGQVMEDRGVSVEDARWLVMCLQRFYGGWDGVGDRARADERRRLLEWFGRGDARFSVERLLEEAERMG